MLLQSLNAGTESGARTGNKAEFRQAGGYWNAGGSRLTVAAELGPSTSDELSWWAEACLKQLQGAIADLCGALEQDLEGEDNEGPYLILLRGRVFKKISHPSDLRISCQEWETVEVGSWTVGGRIMKGLCRADSLGAAEIWVECSTTQMSRLLWS